MQSTFDKEDREFDTPTLRDVLITRNPKDEHGKTSQLTAQQIDDLAEYLLSL